MSEGHQWCILGVFYIQFLMVSTFGYHGSFVLLLIILHFVFKIRNCQYSDLYADVCIVPHLKHEEQNCVCIFHLVRNFENISVNNYSSPAFFVFMEKQL